MFVADSLEREQRKQTLCFAYSSLGSSFFSTGNDTVESVVGKWNDELSVCFLKFTTMVNFIFCDNPIVL